MRVRARRERQQGYVLLMVLAALAVMAYVAQRFAQRNDDLRRNALDFTQYAEARASVASLLSTTLYWNATRPLMPAGRGDPNSQLRQDGQRYTTPDGAFIAIQDCRGLLSINGGNRQALVSLLVQQDVPVQRAQAMSDVLDDYIDTDQLKHLNGAERPEYQALGLTGPRNDWLVSLRELETMPLWRDDPALLLRLSRWFCVDSIHPHNPATAPAAVLKAMFPTANQAMLDLIVNLRRSDLLRDARAAQTLTGLPFNSDDYLFAPGNESRVTLWATGLPRALEYNVRMLPAGELGPWVITEQHSIARPTFPDEAPPVLPFPAILGKRQQTPGQPAP